MCYPSRSNHLVNTNFIERYPSISFIFSQCSNITEKKIIGTFHICLRKPFKVYIVKSSYTWDRRGRKEILPSWINVKQRIISIHNRYWANFGCKEKAFLLKRMEIRQLFGILCKNKSFVFIAFSINIFCIVDADSNTHLSCKYSNFCNTTKRKFSSHESGESYSPNITLLPKKKS